MSESRPLLTIQQVSSKLGIAKHTLRFWEREFADILVPLRSSGGQRRYAPSHLSVIEEIRSYRRKGMSLREIRQKMGAVREESSRGAGDIEWLAEKVAELVRAEIEKFFDGDRGSQDD